MVDGLAKRSFLSYPADVGYVVHFNTLETEEGYSDILEHFYQKLENDFPEAAQRTIANNKFCNDQDKGLILELIAILYIRNQRQRAYWENKYSSSASNQSEDNPIRGKDFDQVMKKLGSNLKTVLESSTRDNQLPQSNERQQDKIVSDPYQNLHIQRELNDRASILSELFQRHWNFWKAPHNSPGFITSDHPAIMIGTKKTKEDNTLSLSDFPTMLVFPLSNTLALIGASFKRGTIEISEAEIAAVNTIILGSAQRQIYAKDAHFLYQFPPDIYFKKGGELYSDERFLKIISARSIPFKPPFSTF